MIPVRPERSEAKSKDARNLRLRHRPRVAASRILRTPHFSVAAEVVALSTEPEPIKTDTCARLPDGL